MRSSWRSRFPKNDVSRSAAISTFWRRATRVSRNARRSCFVVATGFVVAFSLWLEGISAEPDRGKSEFERICSGCHGKEGIGAVGPRLVPFTKSDREVLAIVREGSGQMPAISVTDISDENVAAVAEYLRQLTVASQFRSRDATSLWPWRHVGDDEWARCELFWLEQARWCRRRE